MAEENKVKAWMKKEGIFDNDVCEILVSQGVKDPETDFKTYTQKQWDELWRKGAVERAKELKDQAAKVNHEKKLKKLEKFWRKESGIKLTSIKDTGDEKQAKPVENSAAAQAEALEKGAALKKYLQKNDCFQPDLVLVLVQTLSICSEEDIEKIDTQNKFDEVYRQLRVIRAQDLKDQAAKVRLEKMMTKFEKLWRAKTGIKKTSIKKGKKSEEKEAKPIENSAAAQADALKKGSALKKYLQKNDCFSPDLVLVLVQTLEVVCEEDIEKIDTQKKFDEVYRQIRVIRAQDVKDSAARVRMEKMMTKFEKLWRGKTGIKTTSVKKGGKKKAKKDPKTAKNEAMAADGGELKKWMRKNDVWEMALYEELMARDINDPSKLSGITEKKFDEIVRKVRVDRFSQLKDQQARNRADKLLVKFEKEWRKASGIKKTSLK